MNCNVCEKKTYAVNSWLSHCKNCQYYTSNLKPEAGADVSGLEKLREKNFHII